MCQCVLPCQAQPCIKANLQLHALDEMADCCQGCGTLSCCIIITASVVIRMNILTRCFSSQNLDSNLTTRNLIFVFIQTYEVKAVRGLDRITANAYAIIINHRFNL